VLEGLNEKVGYEDISSIIEENEYIKEITNILTEKADCKDIEKLIEIVDSKANQVHHD
jgi:hypothetical protein